MAGANKYATAVLHSGHERSFPTVLIPRAATGRNKSLMLFFAAAGLAGAVACFYILKSRRPAFVSLGTISFGLGCLSLILSILLFLLLIRRRPDSGASLVFPLDAAFAGTLVVSLGSFFAATRDRSLVYQPLLLLAAFSFYLLVRLGRDRLSASGCLRIFTGISLIAGIEAFHGLTQLAAGSELKGFFFNSNHLSMFLCLALPLSAGLTFRKQPVGIRGLRFAIVLLMAAAIVLSGCRTAYLALVLVAGAAGFAFFGNRRGKADRFPKHVRAVKLVVFGVFAVAAAALLGLSFKQLSAAGRLLIWKASVPMILERPVAGFGAGNFVVFYNLYQGRYFDRGHGSLTERLSASSPAYAFNDYLETAVETGALGLVVNGAFWSLCLMSAAAVFRRFSRARVSGPAPDGVSLGAAGSVLAFLVMSFFYYPGRIVPVYLLFAGLLAWTAGEGERPIRLATGGRRLRSLVLGYAVVSAVGSAMLLPALWGQFGAERNWSEARNLVRKGDTPAGIVLCRKAARHLGWNTNFLEDFGKFLLDSGSPREAVVVLQKATARCPSPYALEKIAAARMMMGDLAGARDSALLAGSILPWRLTSKSLLMDILGKLGDARGSARSAGRILETPLKIRTAEGLEMKRRALGAWMSAEKDPDSHEFPILDVLTLIPGEFRLDVIEALQTAGRRAALFVDAVRHALPEERPGLAFLLANMPARDLGSLDVAGFAEDVHLAYEARRTIPLASAVPEDIFLNYVVPYAVANERRDRWRPEYFRRFRAAAEACPSIEEMAMAVNRDVFVFDKLSYLERDNRKNLLSPGQVMARGYVSCGEAALLVVDGCRSVGIPARLTVLPRWPKSKAGHFWVEVYDRGRWRKLTAFDPSPLDRTWIQGLVAKIVPVRPENRIYAISFRRTPIRIMFGGDVSFLDVTGDYIR
jgi:O-antigen ligase